MIRLKETITVNEDIEAVFDYVADFRHIEQWDSSVSKSDKITQGPVSVGTVYRLSLRYAGVSTQMEYTISVYERPSKVVLEGRGDSFRAVDTIQFSSGETGTRIEYQADIMLEGASGWREAVLKPLLRSAGKKAMHRLQKGFRRNNRSVVLGSLEGFLDKSIVGGAAGFTQSAFNWRRKRWNPQPAFLNGRTVVVTGATSGIGRAAAEQFASLGARVALLSRNPAKLEVVRDEITRATGNANVVSYAADLSLTADVRRVANKILAREAAVHVLVNNAGALFNRPELTGEGVEATMATNLLGPYLLTILLRDLLKKSAPSRIINVSSGGMYTQKLQTADLGFKKGAYDGRKAYARAKRGVVMVTEMWAEQFKDDRISVHAMHPGWVNTPGLQQALPAFSSFLGGQLRTPEQGADTIVWLATAPAAAIGTGQFWLDRKPRETCLLPGTCATESERQHLLTELDRMTGGAT